MFFEKWEEGGKPTTPSLNGDTETESSQKARLLLIRNYTKIKNNQKKKISIQIYFTSSGGKITEPGKKTTFHLFKRHVNLSL